MDVYWTMKMGQEFVFSEKEGRLEVCRILYATDQTGVKVFLDRFGTAPSEFCPVIERVLLNQSHELAKTYIEKITGITPPTPGQIKNIRQ